MSAKPSPVLDPGELNDTDEALLDLLHDGRVTPPYAADELDKSREYISERLIRLKEHDAAKRIAPGLYELVEDPRAEEGDQKTNVPTRDVVDDYLWEHYDVGLDELEDLRAEKQRLERELHTADAQDRVDVDRVARALDQAETAAERGDPQALQDALDDAREALQDGA
jgi:hypothetical protein